MKKQKDKIGHTIFFDKNNETFSIFFSSIYAILSFFETLFFYLGTISH